MMPESYNGNGRKHGTVLSAFVTAALLLLHTVQPDISQPEKDVYLWHFTLKKIQ